MNRREPNRRKPGMKRPEPPPAPPKPPAVQITVAVDCTVRGRETHKEDLRMTAKQLAERLGIDQKELDFVIGEPCSKCKRVGGVNKPCDKEKCVVVAVVEVKEGA